MRAVRFAARVVLVLALVRPLLFVVDSIVSLGDPPELPPNYAEDRTVALVVENPRSLEAFSYTAPPTFYVYPDESGYLVGFHWVLQGPIDPKVRGRMYLDVPPAVSEVRNIDWTLDFPQGNQRVRWRGSDSTPDTHPQVVKQGRRTTVPLDLVLVQTVVDERGENVEKADVGFLQYGLSFYVRDAAVAHSAVGKHRPGTTTPLTSPTMGD